MILIKRTNIKAFTIFELLITMVVTSLLITLVISMFFRFNEFFLLRKKQWENNTEVLRFIKTLGDDIDRSKTISYFDKSLVVIHKNIPPTTYMFNDREILRKSEFETDTFHLQLKIINISYFKNNLETIDKIVISSSSPKTLEFSLDLKKDYQKKSKFNFDQRN